MFFCAYTCNSMMLHPVVHFRCRNTSKNFDNWVGNLDILFGNSVQCYTHETKVYSSVWKERKYIFSISLETKFYLSFTHGTLQRHRPCEFQIKFHLHCHVIWMCMVHLWFTLVAVAFLMHTNLLSIVFPNYVLIVWPKDIQTSIRNPSKYF
jgi:hypothetical protein